MAEFIAVRARYAVMTLLVCATGLVASTSAWGQTPPPFSGRRVALSIGNAAYERGRLTNTINDARAIGASLQQAGFSVDVVLNATHRQTEDAVNRFIEKIQPGDVALFYYSGHGFQLDNENYLVPIDFDPKDEEDAKYLSYSVSRVHDRITGKRARLTILVLDACRSNPYRSARGSNGLAMMSAVGQGSFIGFATGPGNTADDNPRGVNGTFTTALLAALAKPGRNLDQVFSEARELTANASNGRQVPWTSSSVIGDFYFRPPAAPAPPTNVATTGGRGRGSQPMDPFAPIDFDRPPAAPAAGGRGTPPRTNNTVVGSSASSTDPAVAQYRQSCEGGVAEGCWNLGLMYRDGRGVPQSDSDAFTFFERACNGGSVTGCEGLGRVYELGLSDFFADVPKDATRARSLYQRACDAGRATACMKIGDMYSTGTFGERDPVQARTWYERACTAANRQCWRLAESYMEERARLVAAFGQPGWDWSTSAKLKERAAAQAVTFYERSCLAGHAYGCLQLGELYRPNGAYDDVTDDRAKALATYQRGCAIEQANQPRDPLEPALNNGRLSDVADGGANCGAAKRLSSTR